MTFDLELLKNLVEIPTLSDDRGRCLAALKLIARRAKAKQIPVTVSGGMLFAGKKEGAKILFLSHIDVVPGSKDQFRLRKRGGLLRGRGVLDMKGPLVVAWEVFVKLWQERSDVLFVVDFFDFKPILGKDS